MKRRLTWGTKLLSGLVVLSLMASCDLFKPVTQSEDKYWEQRVERDDCGIVNIIDSYYEAGEHFSVPTVDFDDLRQDENAELRSRYKSENSHLLKYIHSADGFIFRPGCRTSFDNLLGSYNSQRPKPNFVDYQDYRALPGNRLCRVISFGERDGDGKPNQQWPDYGYVLSCIYVKTGITSFKVVHLQ